MYFIIGLIVFIIAVAVVLYFVGAGIALEWEEECAVIVETSADEVFEYVQDLQNWELWMAWNEGKQGKVLEFEYSNPSSGIGAYQEWRGSVLEGKLTITHRKDSKSKTLEYLHEIGRKFKLKGIIFVAITDIQHVQIAWRVSASAVAKDSIPLRYQSNLLRKYIAEGMEMSLANLKDLLEK
ncbi:MAG: hypothetical protein MK212_04115 [Saprospiraceae bacterium]|nr:hypothetical protein [Saprospiraceae bacterium]